MGLGGALRVIIRPLSSSQHILPLLSLQHLALKSPLPARSNVRINPSPFIDSQSSMTMMTNGRSLSSSSNGRSLIIGSLTDTRLPKRRPGMKPRRKRASLRPKGPYAWVPYVPGEPIPSSRPNEGSVKGRKRRKRIAQRKAFILSETKKRKVQWAEARKKKAAERIERKMAAVAREKAWAERLMELQKLEAEKKAAMA